MNRRRVNWKIVLLAALILGVVISVLSTPAFAVANLQGRSDAKRNVVTRIDPFALRVVTVARFAAASRGDLGVTPVGRQAIRIPLRPTIRSAFRPVW